MANLISQNGGQPQKQPKWTSLFVGPSITGLFTQRPALLDPSDTVTAKFYGGRTDAAWDGLNVELGNSRTYARRPGLSPLSASTYDSPDRGFSFILSNGTIRVLIDESDAVYWENSGTKVLVYTKAAGAGQAYFQSVSDVCYIGDGVSCVKYTPLNPNGTLWNWGLAAPTAQPTVTPVESGVAAVTWQAATMFTTMGLLNDGTNVQFLVSTMQDGNTTQFGESGAGTPNFDTVQGTITTDNTCNWTSHGQVQLWKSGHAFAADSVIYDVASNGVYNNFGTPGTSGSGRPNFNPTFNTHTDDNGIKWQYIGAPQLWQPNTTYNAWWEFPNQMVCYPILPTLANLTTVTQPIYIFTNNDATTGSHNNPGTSGTSYTPVWATIDGTQTSDNQLLWTCLGSNTWAATTAYAGWAQGSSAFSAIVDGNGNFQVCTVTGTSGTTVPLNGWFASTAFATSATIAVVGPSGTTQFTATTGGTSDSTEPSWNYTSGATTTDGSITWTSNGISAVPGWGKNYGSSTLDGSVTWVNAGTAANSTWVTNTIWYLPANGFSPPQSSAPYGGASVIGASFVQFVTQSGLSDASAPSWPTTVGDTVADNTITWTTTAPYSASDFSLAWTAGYYYGVCFANRLASDFWNTNTPPGLTAPLGVPTGAMTGSVSTMSPVNSFLANSSNSGAVNTITGLGSTDPQCDTVIVFRSADGGGSDELFWLTEFANPVPVGGNAQPWTFKDYLPDLPATIGGVSYPGLNPLILAPQDDENDPPPTGYIPFANHFQRIWGGVGNTVYFSGGPDVLVGNPNECFNPSDDFPFLSTVTNAVHTPSGLIICTITDFDIIAGGPQTTSFYSTTLVPGVGLLGYNAMDIHGGELYFVAADAQFLTITPQLQMTRSGFAIGDKLAAFNPALAYVAVYENGTDNCVFVGDGSTGWYRLNPHQYGCISGYEAVWSPFAAITGGCKMIQTIQTAPGVKKLLVGGTGSGQPILYRDLSVYSDNGTAYDSFVVFGSMVLAHPGEIAVLGFIECDFAGVGSQPTPSYLLNEVNTPQGTGTFTTLTKSVSDPPSIYGATGAPVSYFANRYYLAQNPQLSRCRHMQLKIDFGNTDTVKNELYGFTLYGRVFVEK